MEVAEGFLVGTDKEDAEHVLVALFDLGIVKREGGIDAAGVGEFVDLAVAVASDVREHGIAGGLLLEAVDGHDRKDLVDGPQVGKALEHAEVAVVEIGHDGVQTIHLTAIVATALEHGGNPGEDVPVELLAVGALAEVDLAVVELAAELVAVINGVVVDLLEAVAGGLGGVFFSVETEFVEIAQQGRGVFVDLDFGDALAGLEAVDVEDVDDQDGVIGHDGAAGLGDEIRVRYSSLGSDFGDGLDDVGAVFLGAVVAAGFGGAFETVVADGEAAAEVEDAHAGAFLNEADVNARGLSDGLADGADVWNLRALVIVQHAEAVEHAALAQVIDHVHELGDVEAEDAGIAAGAAPVAGAFSAEAEANAEGGADAHLFRALKDEVELGGHFENEDDLQAHFLRVEREVDELLVLVAIAHDVGLWVVHVAEGGDELGLAAGLQAVMILAAIAGDLLNHFLLLVHLDGVNATIDALVFAFLDGGGEAFIELVDAPAQEIAETDEEGELGAALAEAFDDGGEGDGLGLLAVL